VSVVDRFDERVEAAFEPLRGNRLVDRVFYTASGLGDWSLVWHLIGVSRAVIDRDRIGDAVALSAVLGVESLLVNQGIKRLFKRSRPVHGDERPHHLRQPSTSSFPSGHASSAFCAATVLTAQQPTLWPVWFSVACVVATSRLHVRIHHGSDVVGGMVIGTVLGLAANAVLS
jgi:undecaprenyl-diphosphatase